MNPVIIDAGWLWSGFIIFILVLVAFDLFVLGANRAKVMSFRQALIWSLAWILMTFIFAFFLWEYVKAGYGLAPANTVVANFLSGYFIEKSLSLDNIFVFLLIFQYFKIPLGYQRRVLTYGILGALILRALIIIVGSHLVQEFSWILYLFGGFLAVTGLHMFWSRHSHDKTPGIMEHPVFRFLSKYLRVAHDYHGDKFFIKRGLRWYVSPLLIVLILIELADIMFATDSIPAVLALTRDPFIVFSSNMFAVMGLRALYFLLGSLLDRFYGLHYGLALILFLIGVKLLIAPWYQVSAEFSLMVILGILIVSALANLVIRKPHATK